MTPEIQLFLKKAKQKIGQPQTILEIGSLNVNGSAREVFGATNDYLGIDITAGKDVDLVLDAHDMFTCSAITPEKFDLVICCETFEHDIFFWVSLENMKKALKKGGWLIITTPGNEVIKHNYPSSVSLYNSIYRYSCREL